MNEDLLHSYVDGVLSGEEAAHVERAAAEDPALAARLRALQEVDRALDLLPGHEPSPEFTPDVLARLHRARRGRVLRLITPIAAAAAILLAVLILPMGENGAPSGPWSEDDYIDYTWEADEETYGSLSLEDLGDLVLKELETT